MGKVKILDGKLIVNESDNDVSVPRLYGSVDDSYVTIIDASFNHRIAFHFPIEYVSSG